MTEKEFKEIANKLLHDCDMCIADGSSVRCTHCDSQRSKFIWKTSAIQLIEAVWDISKENNKSENEEHIEELKCKIRAICDGMKPYENPGDIDPKYIPNKAEEK